MCPFPPSTTSPPIYSTQHRDSPFRLQLPPSPYRRMNANPSTATVGRHDSVKMEPTPEPEHLSSPVEPCLGPSTAAAPQDPLDPEGHLERCSGRNKKSRQRCSAAIGKKAQLNTHPTFLPTCNAHRSQKRLAGWCQFKLANGEKCGRLFGWTPPCFELCHEHQGHPDTPSYFLKLPLELRHEIYEYLLPTTSIGSSTAAVHTDANGLDPLLMPEPPGPLMGSRPHYHVSNMSCCPPPSSIFPIPFLDLLLVNRQVCQEVQELLFSIATFTIDVRKDGTFMCGRRLLEPQRADGSSHIGTEDANRAKLRFLKNFNWSAVKNYRVDILLENWSTAKCMSQRWDEEVEIYDIRDYVSVVVSGILAKSKNLCRLSVRLCLAAFQWPHAQTLANTKLIVGPFERMRNVRQPCLTGVYDGLPPHNQMVQVQRTSRFATGLPWYAGQIWSVPNLPTFSHVLFPGMPDFDAYTAQWTRCISSTSSSPLASKTPIKDMFTSFKEFFSKLAMAVPAVGHRDGRRAFLHRARVAREQEDIVSFRRLRNELIQLWYAYLELEVQKKEALNERLSKMLECDVYPAHEWRVDPGETSAQDSTSRRGNSNGSGSDCGSVSSSGSATLQSPIELNSATMALEGIPMTANPSLSAMPIEDRDYHEAMTSIQECRYVHVQHHAALGQVLARQRARAQLQALTQPQPQVPSAIFAALHSTNPPPTTSPFPTPSYPIPHPHHPDSSYPNPTQDQVQQQRDLYPNHILGKRIKQEDSSSSSSSSHNHHEHSNPQTFTGSIFQPRPHPKTAVAHPKALYAAEAGPSSKRQRLNSRSHVAGRSGSASAGAGAAAPCTRTREIRRRSRHTSTSTSGTLSTGDTISASEGCAPWAGGVRDGDAAGQGYGAKGKGRMVEVKQEDEDGVGRYV